MAKNILLLFLSTIRVVKDGDKIKIQETPYNNIEGEPTRTTNESAVRYLIQKVGSISRIFIIISNAVNKDIEFKTKKEEIPYIDENGNTKTHLDYFKERISHFLPDGEKCEFEDCPYDEQSTGNQNLKSVAEIAGSIQKYAKECGEEVTLHVDLTGGMRHINMIILEIIRLLEYSGIKIDKLLYSNYDRDHEENNKVEELKNIYDLFQLTAGVEEFVSFGSVKALKKYYDRSASEAELSENLKRLIKAMESFAEEIKLCHYGRFRTSIIELHDSVHDFKPDPDNLQDLLMARLIGRVRKEYSNLLKFRELDDLRVIRWCIKHGYMQQALTLYTERIPEYIGEHKLVELSEFETKKINKRLSDDEINFYFFLLNHYKNNRDKDNDYDHFQITNKNVKKIIGKLDELNSEYVKLIKIDAMQLIHQKKFDYNAWSKKVQRLKKDVITDIIPQLRLTFDVWKIEEKDLISYNECQVRCMLEFLAKACNKDQEALILLNSCPNSKLDFLNPILQKVSKELEKLKTGYQKRDIITNYIENAKEKDLKDLFSIFHLNISPPVYRLHDMIFNEIFKVNIDEFDFLKIMDRYFRLKKERNQSNHARRDSGEFNTATELQDFMVAGIDELEKFVTI